MSDVDGEGGRKGGGAEEGLLGGVLEEGDDLSRRPPGSASNEGGQGQGRGKAEEVGSEGGRGGRGGRGKGTRESSEGVAKDLAPTSILR